MLVFPEMGLKWKDLHFEKWTIDYCFCLVWLWNFLLAIGWGSEENRLFGWNWRRVDGLQGPKWSSQLGTWGRIWAGLTLRMRTKDLGRGE